MPAPPRSSVPGARALRLLRAAALLLVAAGPAGAAPSASGAADPRAVLERAEQGRKLDNSAQRVRMVLVSRGGAERTREFELKVRRDGDVVRSYTRFLSPADVAGTQLVVVDHPETADEQLMFMPALKRTTRVAGKARSGSFMGSDFAFEDLEVSAAKDATHVMVLEDAASWVIDTTPGPGSSYGRLRTTVRKSDNLPVRVDFFDKAGKPLKSLEVTAVSVKDGVTFPKVSVMTHAVAGTQTRLEVLESRTGLPAAELPDALFTASWMERHP